MKKNGKRIVSDQQILDRLRNNMTATEIANEFGITSDAVRKRIKKMGQRALPYILQRESAIMGVQLDTQKQMLHINQKTFEILNNPKTKVMEQLAAIKRIERQNEIQLKMMQVIFSISEIKAFQESVLSVLQEVDPDVREAVIEKLSQRRSAISLLKASCP